MARIYSRAKGKAGSLKPSKRSVPSWVRYKPKEVEILVQKLSKEGHTSSEIGIMLRDSYGIPDVRTITSKSVTQILSEKGIAPKIPEDLFALMKRSVSIRKHLQANKHDQTAVRGLTITESKMKRLINYYTREGKLSKGFKYDEESVKLIVSA